MKFISRAMALLLLIVGAALQAKDEKSVPPAGVQIPDTDRKAFESSLATLRASLDALAKSRSQKPDPTDPLADIEALYKAVDWALRHDEFLAAKQVETAKTLLVEANTRLEALQKGSAPWTSAIGPNVRGFRSRIDGSVQPVGVVVPEAAKTASVAHPLALYVWNHGRSEGLTELAFVSERMHSKGDFAPADAVVVHPYGRFCNATKFAGETDVLEAIQWAEAHYPIDRNRIIMAGFSMGGASVWHLATHYASRWAGATPGAGFAETAIYTKAFAPDKEAPPWWEQTLWHLYNATDYAANLADTTLVAYSGEIDPQKQSADLMEKAMETEGLKMERLIGPHTAHAYEPATKKVLAARLEELASKGRDPVPAKVRLVTYTLRYNQQDWVVAEGLEKHWDRAEVQAEIVDPGAIKAETHNISALTFAFVNGLGSLAKGRTPSIILDGQTLSAPALAEPWTVHFLKTGGKWSVVPTLAADAAALRKKPGIQGPIDDAFMDRFVFVRPTGRPLNDTVGAWTKAELARAIEQWRTVFRGDAQVVDDTAITAAMVKDSNLVLWGDPSSNRAIGKLLPKLPVQWTAQTVQLGKESYPAATTVPILIYPNPLNPDRYIVVNSSFTFRQGSNLSNATQTPKLPDWALVDLRTPPSEKAPGLVIDAGFFGEQWQVQN